jgi:hypothetical protein
MSGVFYVLFFKISPLFVLMSNFIRCIYFVPFGILIEDKWAQIILKNK